MDMTFLSEIDVFRVSVSNDFGFNSPRMEVSSMFIGTLLVLNSLETQAHDYCQRFVDESHVIPSVIISMTFVSSENIFQPQ